MTSLNQTLFDLQVEHLLVVKRYEASTRRLVEEAGARHRSLLSKLLRKDPENKTLLREEVDRYLGELYATANNSIQDYLGAELDFQTNALRKVASPFFKIKAVNRGELAKEVSRTPLRLGDESYATLAKSFEGLRRTAYVDLSARIRRGIAAGASEQEL